MHPILQIRILFQGYWLVYSMVIKCQCLTSKWYQTASYMTKQYNRQNVQRQCSWDKGANRTKIRAWWHKINLGTELQPPNPAVSLLNNNRNLYSYSATSNSVTWTKITDGKRMRNTKVKDSHNLQSQCWPLVRTVTLTAEEASFASFS